MRLLLILILLLSFLVISNSLPLNFPKQDEKIEKEEVKRIFGGYAELYIPAVDSNGNGVVTKLIVQAVPGNGKTLVNIESLLFWVDTQFSIRTAKEVAENFLNISLDGYDIVYTIQTNASIIEGQSAGAALTIATIAALQNKTLNKSVMITGTINPDGSIGSVGGIPQKAIASKQVGAKLFLVPKGQLQIKTLKPITRCEEFETFTFCETVYVEEKIDAKKEFGIEIKEVSNLREALKYFLA